ncbi:MAG: 8-amino-7-oxononanoate synthase [Phycisphaerae bacterium]|jgi:8-amino-7-oxononanoate synthase
MTVWQDMEESLAAAVAADLLRRPVVLDSACGPRVKIDGREVVCLCSNDYLSLANDPAVKAAAAAALDQWGVGAGASRLVSGTSRLHVQLEEELAAFKGTEAALATSTGWMANHAAIAALAGEGDLILCDKLNHASIIDAAQSCGARLRTYGHCDMDRLERLLSSHRGQHRRCLIVTDSLFSMDGNLAPLGEIVALKQRYDAMLLIDEAHATGVLGPLGRGAAELLGVEEQVDAVVGTLSKAIGGLGGFVAGRRVLVETIVNSGRAFIYTTALPPALCAAAIESIRIIQAQPQRREKLLQLAARVRPAFAQQAPAGAEAGANPAVTQIIPIMIGPAGQAMAVSRALLKEGFLVPAIRPPTVPKGTSRLRVSLCSGHTMGELIGFVSALEFALRVDRK